MIKKCLLRCRPYTKEVTRGGAKKIINRTVNLMLRRSISFELYAKEYQLCLGVGGRRSCVRRIIIFSVVSNSAMKWSIFVCSVVCLARFCDGLAIKCQPGATDPSCTEERKGYNIPEPNQPLSAATEVQCLAGSEWESNCHSCRCSFQGRAQCLKQSNDCDRGGLAQPALCKTNTSFKMDCNFCSCENGLAICTLMNCRSDILLSAPGTLLASVNSELDDKDAQKATKTDVVALDLNHYVIENLLNLDHDVIILKRSTICKPLQEFMRDCNPCKCASDGLSYSCTHNECLETEKDMDTEVEVFMKSEGQDHIERHSVCRASNTFYIGCNTCRCNAIGTDYSCTNKPCPLPADVELFHELKDIKPAVPYSGESDHKLRVSRL